MDNSSQNTKKFTGGNVKRCRRDLKSYFHNVDSDLSNRFKVIYELFGLTDGKISREVGIDKSTMNRYRRGVFIPTNQMKLLIAQAISKLSNYQTDSAVIWGDSLIFEKWREAKK